MSQILKQYEHQIDAIETEREKLSKKEKYLPLMRFIFFISSLVLIYNYLIFTNTTFLVLSAVALLTFVLLTFRDNLLKDKIERCGMKSKQ